MRKLWRLPNRALNDVLRENGLNPGPDCRSESTRAKIERRLGVNLISRSSGARSSHG